MRKVMTGVGLAAVLALGPTAAAFAQTDNTAQQQVDTNNDDGGGKAGLAGLAGLLGLLGLAGLKKNNKRDTGYTGGATTGTGRTP